MSEPEEERKAWAGGADSSPWIGEAAPRAAAEAATMNPLRSILVFIEGLLGLRCFSDIPPQRSGRTEKTNKPSTARSTPQPASAAVFVKRCVGRGGRGLKDSMF